MSSEEETPEAVETAKRFEEDMELINRARNEVLAVSIAQTPRETVIAEFEAECAPERELNPLDVNSNVARLRIAARTQKTGTVQ